MLLIPFAVEKKKLISCSCNRFIMSDTFFYSHDCPILWPFQNVSALCQNAHPYFDGGRDAVGFLHHSAEAICFPVP